MGGRHMAKINGKTEDRKLGGDVNQRDSHIHLFLRGVSQLWRAKSQVGRQWLQRLQSPKTQSTGHLFKRN